MSHVKTAHVLVIHTGHIHTGHIGQHNISHTYNCSQPMWNARAASIHWLCQFLSDGNCFGSDGCIFDRKCRLTFFAKPHKIPVWFHPSVRGRRGGLLFHVRLHLPCHLRYSRGHTRWTCHHSARSYFCELTSCHKYTSRVNIVSSSTKTSQQTINKLHARTALHHDRRR